MSEQSKIDEIKSELEEGKKFNGDGLKYLDDEQVSWLIEQLEQAQQENKRLIEALEAIKTYTRSTFQNEGSEPSE